MVRQDKMAGRKGYVFSHATAVFGASHVDVAVLGRDPFQSRDQVFQLMAFLAPLRTSRRE